jgi:hypothetical protein
VRSRWFFDIYIQGSKNNFKELSLKINGLEVKISRPVRVSVIIKISGRKTGTD